MVGVRGSDKKGFKSIGEAKNSGPRHDFRAEDLLEACSIGPYTGSMHVHVHGAGGPTRVLKISLAVTLAYIGLLVVAGIRAHSLALLSEAGHNLSDFLALLLSLVALEEFSVDVIAIDRRLLERLFTGARDAALVRAIAETARTFARASSLRRRWPTWSAPTSTRASPDGRVSPSSRCSFHRWSTRR